MEVLSLENGNVGSHHLGGSGLVRSANVPNVFTEAKWAVRMALALGPKGWARRPAKTRKCQMTLSMILVQVISC